jgi:hypothetical protein
MSHALVLQYQAAVMLAADRCRGSPVRTGGTLGGRALMEEIGGQSAPGIEAQRLAFDIKIQEARLALDTKIQEAGLATEINRDKRESTFFRANAAVIITSLVALMTVIISASQFYFSFRQEREKQNFTETQDSANRIRDAERYSSETTLRIDEERLKILEYLTANSKNIFSDDINIRRQYRTIMLTALPKESVKAVFEQLHNSIPNDRIWILGPTIPNWNRTGVGDCGGRDVGSTDGDTPSLARCDTGFEGRIAVCWDGQEHRNGGPRKWCTYKSATPETCSGGSSPGTIYQCSLVIQTVEEQKSQAQ